MFNFIIYLFLVSHPKQDEECKGQNRLGLLVGFPNNYLVVSGITLSNFWILSWANYVEIMYVLYCFNVFWLC